MNEEPTPIFKKRNYQLMVLGILLIVAGFLLMAGGGGDDPAVFKTDQVYSFRRITLAPLLVLAGFALEFVAIFKK